MRSDLWTCDICGLQANGGYGLGASLKITNHLSRDYKDLCGDCRKTIAHQIDILIAKMKPTSDIRCVECPPAAKEKV